MKKASIVLFAAGGVAACSSQAPEAISCYDAEGRNATEWFGGDIEFPHCDSEYMSDTANTIHDVGKITAIVTVLGSAACCAISSRSPKVHEA